jgi:dolichol kinase
MTDNAETFSPATLPLDASEPGSPSNKWRTHRRTADAVFRGALAVTLAITAIWLFFVVTERDGGAIFNGYRVSPEAVGRVLIGFTIVYVLWGWLWYGIKVLLLRRFVGLTKEDVRTIFISRMSVPFDLAGLLQRYSERRIRIADMIGRRGRFLTMGMLGYWYVYSSITRDPKPSFLVSGLQENLFDAIAFNWMMLAIYYSNGFLGRVAYGAQSRIMDGTLARANCLLISTLWSLFKFFMVPLGFQIAGRFPPRTYATVFSFIWISYLTSDALSEIVGSLFGKQKLRVWGIGEVNRKSLAGTWACFLGSFGLCLTLVFANSLPLAWVGLALAVSVSNTVFELFSPRGTDDFTMASANALLCWAFGLLVNQA